MVLEELIDAVCHALSPDERKNILETGGMEVDGVPFTFIRGTEDDASGLYVYCDFGELPEVESISVMKRLLEINFFLFAHNAPSFMFNPVTEHVLLAWRMNGSELTSERFTQVLHEMGSYARLWRAHHFLIENAIDLQNNPALLLQGSAPAYAMSSEPR